MNSNYSSHFNKTQVGDKPQSICAQVLTRTLTITLPLFGLILVFLANATTVQDQGRARVSQTSVAHDENLDELGGRPLDLSDEAPDLNGPPGQAGGQRNAPVNPAVPLQAQMHGKKLPRGGSSSGVARGDFNGDGFADLAIGAPGEGDFAGAVIVIHGSATGLTATNPAVPASQFWSLSSFGVPSVAEPFNEFGYALASGDFNGDNFSDLAIAAPRKVVRGCIDGLCRFSDGAVMVIYGSPNGLTAFPPTGIPRPQLWHSGLLEYVGPIGLECDSSAECPGVGEGSSASPGFGSSLAWGDFNGDGIGDLAVGHPREIVNKPEDPIVPFGFVRSGAVYVIFGSRANGLTSRNNQALTPFVCPIGVNCVGGIKEAFAEEDEAFGAVLSTGDFSGDGKTDLAVGAPLKDYGREGTNPGIDDAGVVFIFHARSDGTGFFPDPVTVFSKGNTSERSVGVGDSPTRGDRWGEALAAGDFDGDGRSDLAIGCPSENLSSSLVDAGAVDVLYSRSAGLLGFKLGLTDQQFWTQDIIFTPRDVFFGSVSEGGDAFGYSLAAGDFNGDGRADLAIGAPLEDVLVNRGTFFESVVNAGEVDVLYGAAGGLSIRSRAPQHWSQASINIEDDAEAGDQFGQSLSAWNFGRNESQTSGNITVVFRTADLAIGVPFEDVGSGKNSVKNAGAVNVIYGNRLNANGLTSANDQIWTQASPGLPGSVLGALESSDNFGLSLY